MKSPIPLSPVAKFHLLSAAYCGVLVSLNWFRTVTYDRTVGLASESYTPVAFAYFIAVLVVVVLAVRGVLLARRHLEAGTKIRSGPWIWSGSAVIYAAPLLWHRTTGSSWIEPDGALAKATEGFGHELSSSLFFLAVAGILLVQIVARLSPE